MKFQHIIKSAIFSLTILLLGSCGKDFLQKVPQGKLSDTQVPSAKGVEQALIGAYAIMNGNVNGTWGNYGAAPSQWVFGEITSDNAHKGSEATDQPNMNLLEAYNYNSANDNLANMWQVYYEGILRANKTINILAEDQAGKKEVKADRVAEIQGEARMLRAHYYFFLWRIFKNIPWVDENTTTDEAKTKANDTDVIPNIIEDLKFAIDNLPVEKINGEAGRMDKNIAKAYLGKVYLYQKQYNEALTLFKEVLEGKDIVAMAFQNNFDVTKEDGPEALLVAKHALNADGGGDNANVGDMLAGVQSGPEGCCGFYQPTIDLVNAFKVDANGLPFLDDSYRTENVYKSDLGLDTTASKSYELNVKIAFDPRIDYTVGRRGVQFLDYGVMPGQAWIREIGQFSSGPFISMKQFIQKSQLATYSVAGTNQLTALDVNIMRLADVVLMAAECEVELNNLPEALRLVNSIRERAAKLPAKKTGTGVDAAAYSVKPYPSFSSQDQARKAVRFERRLELAMEGHRFFDLVRWGIAKQAIESYSAFEGTHLPAHKGLTFDEKDTYFPIPLEEIDKSGGALTQNTGY